MSFKKLIYLNSIKKNYCFSMSLQLISIEIFDISSLTISALFFFNARINGVLLKYFYRSIPLKKMYLYEMSLKKINLNSIKKNYCFSMSLQLTSREILDISSLTIFRLLLFTAIINGVL